MHRLNSTKPLRLIENNDGFLRINRAVERRGRRRLRLNRDVEVGADPGADIGKLVEIGRRGIQEFGYRLGLLGIHLQDFRRDGELRLTDLGADECGYDRTNIHDATKKLNARRPHPGRRSIVHASC